MKKAFSFLWKYKLVTFPLLLIAIIVFFLLLPKEGPEKVVPQGATWEEITPGETTKEGVVKILGEPLEEKDENGKTVSFFKSTSPTRNHEILFEEQIVSFSKEIVTLQDEKEIEDIKTLHGTTDNVLYGPDSYNGYFLFVYPEKGIAYLGNPGTGDLLEVWYFIPNSMDEFRSLYAPGYQTELSPQF